MRSSVQNQLAPFTEAVFICSKCAAKLGRGRKGKTDLRGEIKHALKAEGLGKKVRIVETTCLDLCPKGGQTVATLRQLARGELAVVDGTASGAQVVALLFGARALVDSRDGGSVEIQDIAQAVRRRPAQPGDGG